MIQEGRQNRSREEQVVGSLVWTPPGPQPHPCLNRCWFLVPRLSYLEKEECILFVHMNLHKKCILSGQALELICPHTAEVLSFWVYWVWKFKGRGSVHLEELRKPPPGASKMVHPPLCPPFSLPSLLWQGQRASEDLHSSSPGSVCPCPQRRRPKFPSAAWRDDS